MYSFRLRCLRRRTFRTRINEQRLAELVMDSASESDDGGRFAQDANDSDY